MSGELVLVVCSANVCRSALAEQLLRDLLEDLPDIRVGSAGTRVRESTGICEMVAARGDGDAWQDSCRRHQPQPVTTELLNQASLILVADTDVRSEVVRAAPEIRDLVFTFRDAAFLAEGYTPAASTRRAGPASRFAMHLDRTRAVRGRPTTRHSCRRKRRGRDWSSIVDAHGRDPRHHERALQEVTESMVAIASALAGPRFEQS